MTDKPRVTQRERATQNRMIRHKIGCDVASEAVGEMEPGCDLFGLTMGRFSLIDLICHCLDSTGPADVVITTFQAARADIDIAYELLRDGRITSLRFLVDFSFQAREPEFCAALRERFGDNAIRVSKVHTKFVTITNDQWNIAIRTSMNLNENPRLEHFDLSDDPTLAGFLVDFVDEVFDRQSVDDTFGRRPIEHVNRFGEEWERLTVQDPENSVYFGEGVLDNDIRRSGITFE